jgi:large subunit ribosomal protein L21
VELLHVNKGDTVNLDKVLFVADNDRVTVGTPTIEGAKVIATAQEEFKGEKIIVFKYKAKTRYRNKNGHRQSYTKLAIDKIEMPGASVAAPVKKAGRPKKEVTESGS